MKLLISLCLIFVLMNSAYSETIKEPKTGVSFEDRVNMNGKDLELSGVGVRSKLMVKVYAGGLYLEPSARTILSQYKDQTGKVTQELCDAIINAPFSKLFVLHFVRDVDGEKIVDAFKEGLEKSMDIKAADVQKDVLAFLEASNTDMKDGDVVKVYVNGDEITVMTRAGTSEPIKNKKLAAAVTAIWLGKKPVSEDLKKGMLSRLVQTL